MGLPKWLLVASLFVVAAQAAPATEVSDPRVVCYFTNWSAYRPGAGKYTGKDVDPNLCSHLNYAFGSFTKEGKILPSDAWQDIDNGGFSTFIGLKTKNPSLKTMFALGGTAEGSTTFSHIVSESSRRAEFVQNAITFLHEYNFDGLDLDWGKPAFGRGGKVQDKENYAKLIKEMRQGFEADAEATKKPRLLLSVTLPRTKEFIDKGYEVPEITKAADWMNIRGYDFFTGLEHNVGHHSPLYSVSGSPDDANNINFTVNYLIASGADKDKLVLGIPTFGRTFTLADPAKSALGSEATGPGDKGFATGERGFFSYYEICEDQKDSAGGWTVVQPNPAATGPFASKGNQWVGYDDVSSVQRKAEYVNQHGLGGVMFWTIDLDDFQGTCHGKKYPLINAAKETLKKNVI